MVVLKTHIDILSDLTSETITQLQSLSRKHNFLIFEDRKFIDIGNTVQKQYHGGALRISEWAHIVNASILAGDGIVDALAQTASAADFPFGSSNDGNNDHQPEDSQRALLILAEMTSKGSLATGEYTRRSVEMARKHRGFVLGFVSTRSLENEGAAGGGSSGDAASSENEDFVVFTTGVNLSSSGDALGQQYQTPESAIGRGADFIIAGRGIYKAEDPVSAIKRYQEEGWKAYSARVKN